jgi:hypothetical protein
VLAVLRFRLLAIASALALVAAATVLGGMASAAPNPPGNNGTVKVDDAPFDDAPDNEPHVGCEFQVDFYGYDEGDLQAEVTFEAWAPTQRPEDAQVLLTDTVDIGEDDNSGGGSEEGLDASETYTLDFTGIEPHPKQGFHVKLTVHAEGSHGADVKHKVFWVTECPPKPEDTTTTTTTIKQGGKGEEKEKESTTTTTTTKSGGRDTEGSSTTTTTKVPAASSLGEETPTTLGGAVASTAAGERLPFTGASTLPLLVVGLTMLGLGAVMLYIRSRPDRT